MRPQGVVVQVGTGNDSRRTLTPAASLARIRRRTGSSPMCPTFASSWAPAASSNLSLVASSPSPVGCSVASRLLSHPSRRVDAQALAVDTNVDLPRPRCVVLRPPLASDRLAVRDKRNRKRSAAKFMSVSVKSSLRALDSRRSRARTDAATLLGVPRVMTR